MDKSDIGGRGDAVHGPDGVAESLALGATLLPTWGALRSPPATAAAPDRPSPNPSHVRRHLMSRPGTARGARVAVAAAPSRNGQRIRIQEAARPNPALELPT
jgi:hypothetical protein